MAVSLKAMREKLVELRKEMQGLIAACEAENRGLSPEEEQKFDKLGQEYSTLNNTIARADKIPTDLLGRDIQPGVDVSSQNIIDRVRIPDAHNWRTGPLKSFVGPKADEKAYLAGQFFAATLFGKPDSRAWCEDHGISMQQGGSDNALGGYLVPTELERSIIDLVTQYGVARQHLQIVPMGSATKDQPKRLSFSGANWATAENTLLEESEKRWTNVQLVAKKLYALTRYSNELNDDAIISIGDDLATEFARAFAFSEDDALFNGDGSADYGGITGIFESVIGGSIHEMGTNDWTTFELGDYGTALSKLADYVGMEPKWFMSKTGYYLSVAALQLAAGGNTVTDVGRGPERVFLGAPVVWTNVLNKALGADAGANKMVLGDLRMGAMMGVRRGISIALTDHRYFEFDQIGIRGTARLDIKVHDVGTEEQTTAGIPASAGAIIAIVTP